MEQAADSTGFADFETALRQFVRETCAPLSETGPEKRRWTRIVREKDGWSFHEEERPDYERTSFLLTRKIREQPPSTLLTMFDIARKVPALASRLLVDGVGNPIREEKMGLLWVTNVLAGRFLRQYLENAAPKEFDEKAFNLVLDDFKVGIRSITVTIKEISPLTNASLDCETIAVAPYLVLRKLKVEELEEWLNDYLSDPLFLLHGPAIGDVTQLDCAMELTFTKRRNEPWEANQEIRAGANDLVTALRLLTDNNVSIAFTVQRSDGFLQAGKNIGSSLRPHVLGQTALIGTSLQEDIIDTWNRIRPLPTGNPVRRALRRWDTVFERFDEDDALIDYWIALEGLFVPDTSTELRHRSAFRIGAYLGDTPDQRERIYKDLLHSYDLRSKIVHGGAPPSNGKTELIHSTRSYLRRALVQILSSVDKFNPGTIELERLRR